MEENKVFMPPPPKELKNMPPPPPPIQKNDKIEGNEEEKVSLQKENILQNVDSSANVPYKESETKLEGEIINNQPEPTYNQSENELEKDNSLFEKEQIKEVVEQDISKDKKQKEIEKKDKKSSTSLKLALYWMGFVLSLGAVGILIFLLLR